MKKSDINIKRKGEKETMEKEKKQIKISLWTFYVLVAGIVILICAVIIGGMNIKKKMDSLEQGNLASQIENEKNNEKTENTDKAEIAGKNDTTEKEEKLKNVTLDDKDVQKCLAYLGIDSSYEVVRPNENLLGALYYEALENQGKINLNNISNDLILSLAINYGYVQLANEDYEALYNKNSFTKQEIKNNITRIFGKNIKYKDATFNNGMEFYSGFPQFLKVIYHSNNYIVEEPCFETGSDQFIELFDLYLDVKKAQNNMIITMPIAFYSEEGEETRCRIDYYSDLDLSKGRTRDEYGNLLWTVDDIIKNLVAHNYYLSGKSEEEVPQEFARLKQELAVNDGLGTIEENMDKLHKIKMTFTKDDSNEYHFESFEIID